MRVLLLALAVLWTVGVCRRGCSVGDHDSMLRQRRPFEAGSECTRVSWQVPLSSLSSTLQIRPGGEEKRGTRRSVRKSSGGVCQGGSSDAKTSRLPSRAALLRELRPVGRSLQTASPLSDSLGRLLVGRRACLYEERGSRMRNRGAESSRVHPPRAIRLLVLRTLELCELPNTRTSPQDPAAFKCTRIVGEYSHLARVVFVIFGLCSSLADRY